MKAKRFVGAGLKNSGLAAVYIFAVSWLLNNVSKIAGPNKSILMPMAFLGLLVFSVAIMGVLVFGQPLTLYLHGRKKEALKLLGYTLGWLLLFVLAFFAGFLWIWRQ